MSSASKPAWPAKATRSSAVFASGHFTASSSAPTVIRWPSSRRAQEQRPGSHGQREGDSTAAAAPCHRHYPRFHGQQVPKLEDKLKSLPAKPGVYLFRDERGEVLYVGKAKSLRPRVRSYFQAGSDTRTAIARFRSGSPTSR